MNRLDLTYKNYYDPLLYLSSGSEDLSILIKGLTITK